MRRHSSGAALVVTNLPYMTHLPPAFFVDYVDAMTDGLGAVLLVRGSGQEVADEVRLLSCVICVAEATQWLEKIELASAIRH